MTNIDEATRAMCEFLKRTLSVEDAKVVRIIKIPEGCEGEVEVYEESSFIKSIGLSTKVKDRNIYKIMVDEKLDVQSYEKEEYKTVSGVKNMDGLYLYCIREKTEDLSTFRTRGIDGKRKVFTIIYNELEAVVSRVSLSKFASEKIQKKALEDLNWIKEKAVIHEDVIEEAMRGADGLVNVIPMRFGIIFKDKTGLKETLDRDYAKMRRFLNNIRGKQEWSVKAYLMDSKRFELMVTERNEEIRLKKQEMASVPEGMAYFMEEDLKEAVHNEVNKTLDTMFDNLFGKLREEAAESVKAKILDREMTGKTEKMVLNAAFLVHADKVDSFRTILEGFDNDMKTEGLCLEYSGPWPPFNFAN